MGAVRTESGEVEIGTEGCVEHLLEALRCPDGAARRVAVCGLAASRDPRAVEPLIGALDDRDEEVRVRAALALGKLGDHRAVGPLLEVATGSCLPLHRAAMAALGELDAGLDVLATGLEDPDPLERIRAALALGETHDVNAVMPLSRALHDEHRGVRHHVREALEKIRESPVF